MLRMSMAFKVLKACTNDDKYAISSKIHLVQISSNENQILHLINIGSPFPFKFRNEPLHIHTHILLELTSK